MRLVQIAPVALIVAAACGSVVYDDTLLLEQDDATQGGTSAAVPSEPRGPDPLSSNTAGPSTMGQVPPMACDLSSGEEARTISSDGALELFASASSPNQITLIDTRSAARVEVQL